ncbi:MAG: SDR family NAD(P)-dependent oxidoreductase [Chloroflexota bacterium]
MDKGNLANTLVELLSQRAIETPEKVAYTFLEDGEEQATSLTYAELDQRARAIAAHLQQNDVAGERALLLYPSGLEYVAAFFGCLYAGVLAVPLYPPRSRGIDARIQAIIHDAQASIALTTPKVIKQVQLSPSDSSEPGNLRWIATEQLPNEAATEWQEPELTDASLAYLQYTSGSTSTPKGVVISHGNLLYNLRDFFENLDHTPNDVLVSWLPLFHDMGLIFGILYPLYVGIHGVFMPPTAFVQQPIRWLQAITRYRGTHSAAPNFAYELCLEKILDEARASLDLRSWRFSINGAEPVRATTAERFAATFADCGLAAETLAPGYGLAEATLKVTVTQQGRGVTVCPINSVALTENRISDDEESEASRLLVACGYPTLETQVAIVHPDTLIRCAADEIGEIWVSGPTVAQGYWQKEEATQATFHAYLADSGEGPFLRTGDLGFLKEGQLFVTGRLKDLIIIRGRNHYPQDIELAAAGSHPALRADGSAAFAVHADGDEFDEANFDEANGDEKLIVVQEVERTAIRSLNSEEVIWSIRQAIAEEHELQPHAVVLTKPGTIPKTSSGKVQRSACRTQFLQNHLVALASWQAETWPADQIAPSEQSAPSADALQKWLLQWLANRLQISIQQVDPNKALADYGLDSMMATELIHQLEPWWQQPTELEPTLFWRYPTVSALVTHLTEISTDKSLAPVTTKADELPEQGLPDPTDPDSIAIIGVGCRFPGGVDTPQAFWHLLRTGVDAVTEIPPDRRQLSPSTDDASNTASPPFGGFLEQVDRFDAPFFNIAPVEAETMDPQQRLLLETHWEALENAGIAPATLSGSKTGIYVGIATNDYLLLQAKQQANPGAYFGTGTANSVAAGRIAYALGVRGPTLIVDTACSSSLVAVHLACQSLQRGDCTLALASGVNLLLAPDLSQAFANANMLAPDGRCKTFDASANGYVRSEGCGVVVLKRLSHAVTDGDTILAVVRGSAINQDGASNGLTAPNGLAQEEVIQEALAAAHLTPNDISYVEAHGTGTALGDPIEVKALENVYGKNRDEENPLIVGSAKTNLGHTEAAAGLAGLLKVVLALQSKHIPPHLHFETLNPHLANSSIVIPAEGCPWPQIDSGQPRRAGVSSFGFSGSNAHLIVEEWKSDKVARLQSGKGAGDGEPQVIVLSAKNEERLREYARKLFTYLNTLQDHDTDPATSVQPCNPATLQLLSLQPLSLPNIAYSLQIGRDAMEERLAFIVSSLEDLIEQLGHYVHNQTTELRAYRGSTKVDNLRPSPERLMGGKAGEAFIQVVMEESDLDRVAQLWVSGVKVEWAMLYPHFMPRRVSLPTYPFARNHYWFDDEQTRVSVDVRKDYAKEPSLLDSSAKNASEENISAKEASEETAIATPTNPDPKKSLRDLAKIEGQLRQQLADILHISSEEIGGQDKFVDLGLDSITGVEWVEQINDEQDLDIDVARIFDHPTIERFTRYLAEMLPQDAGKTREDDQQSNQVPPQANGKSDVDERKFSQSGGLPPVEEQRTETPTHSQPLYALEPSVPNHEGEEASSVGHFSADSIAIIGMACRFPGANDVDEFWQNIANGVDSIAEVPPDRWDINHYYSPDQEAVGKSYSKWLGAMDDIDQFDPLFFEISPREAQRMDPQQRLFLEEAWKALEDAGYAGQSRSERKCGIFVGAGTGDYHNRLIQNSPTQSDFELDAYTLIGSAPSILAARLSYLLNLKGASLAIDTACSSSLVAIHQGCQSLLTGQNEMVLAGGVSVLAGPQTHIMTSKAQMLSPDGRCKTFDNRADGFGIAEGVGVVVLKRLRDAERDGDQIHGVIKGSGINQDGTTNGITAPSADSQTALELEVYRQAQIDPATIQLVEAHGTGTKLGDPIEIAALTTAFRNYTDQTGYCAIGSVKTNIGHTVAAAGVAGVIKALLALKHKKLPPSLHFEEPNEHINFENSPFYVNTKLQNWQVKDSLRRAAVSSFGFSGTNAHLVLQEWQEPVLSLSKEDKVARLQSGKVAGLQASEIIGGGTSQVVVLSAKNEERLRAYAHKLLTYLEQTRVQPQSTQEVELTADAQIIQQTLQAMVSEIVGMDVAEIEHNQTFEECGLDALQLTHLQTTIEEQYSLELAITPADSVESLAQQLVLRWRGGTTIHHSSFIIHRSPSLSDIAYTLQIGREAMDARLALVVSSVEELIVRLRQYTQNQTAIQRTYQGHTQTNHLHSALLNEEKAKNTLLESPFNERDPERIAQLWVEGVDIDWAMLYSTQKPRLISLPTYPFERKRYWIDTETPPPEKNAPTQSAGWSHQPQSPGKLALKSTRAISLVKPEQVPPQKPKLVEIQSEETQTAEPARGKLSLAIAWTDPELDHSPANETEYRATPIHNNLSRPSASAIRQKVKEVLSATLYLDVDIDEEKPFNELGMDSITGVDFIKTINQTYAIAMKVSRLYDYPTVDSLSAHVVDLLSVQSPPSSGTPSGNEEHLIDQSNLENNKPGSLTAKAKISLTPIPKGEALEKTDPDVKYEQLHQGKDMLPIAQTNVTSGEHRAAQLPSVTQTPPAPQKIHDSQTMKEAPETDIAVIGMSGRFPGAQNLDEYWQNLKEGICSITEIPVERWDIDRFYKPDPKASGKSYSKWGGFLTDVDKFDPLFFNISPTEAEVMDPQQRLVLEEAYHALEDAGYGQHSVTRQACGLYVGVMGGNEYYNQVASTQPAQAMMGNAGSILAGRVAYAFDLQGPVITVDTACSSSLVAVDMACKSLINEEADMMLAGGVTLYLTEELYIGMSNAQMLSPDGLCKTFDNRADGFVPGEGVGFVALKRLSQAIADGDSIYGVIKGSGVNQDGKTNGLTAPNVKSQRELQLAVYKKYGIDPSQITYVETHGTGTKLGDPIEVEALTESFGRYTGERQYCALGSVKTNIGHTSAAAGVAGLIKVLLSLKHGQLPPSLHFQHENEHIGFDETPFYVNTQCAPWQSNGRKPRMAAVSSFGFSGTNAHLVVQEHQDIQGHQDIQEFGEEKRTAAAIEGGQPHLILLSAKKEERLQEVAQRLHTYIANHPTISLADIAYTLQVGREVMNDKLAVLVKSGEELSDKLTRYLAGDVAQSALYRSQTTTNNKPLGLLSKEESEFIIEPLLEQGQLERLAQLWVDGIGIDWSQLYQGQKPRRTSLPLYPFTRERYWIDTRKTERSNENLVVQRQMLHPLVQQNISTFTEQQYYSRFEGTEFFLLDHQVHGEKVLPGVAYLEMARAAVEMAITEGDVTQIKDIFWLKPLIVADEPIEIHIELAPDEQGEIAFHVSSVGKEERLVHSRGKLVIGIASSLRQSEAIEPSTIQARCTSIIEGADCYRRFEEQGLTYGPAFRTIEQIHANEHEVLAQLRLPPRQGNESYGLHPSLLDGALQATIGLAVGQMPRGEIRTYLPFAIQTVELYHAVTESAFAYVQSSATSNGQRQLGAHESDDVVTQKYDIVLTDEHGTICVALQGFTVRALNRTQGHGQQKNVAQTNRKQPSRVLTSNHPEQSHPDVLYCAPRWEAAPLTGDDGKHQGDATCTMMFIGLAPALVSEIEIEFSDWDLVALNPTEPESTLNLIHQCWGHLKKIVADKSRQPHQILVVASDTVDAYLVAPLSALLKTAQLEHPTIRGKVVTVANAAPGNLVTLIRCEMKRDSFDATDVRYDDIGHRSAKALRTIDAPNQLKMNYIRAEGVYWITGGLGALGRLFARHLIERGENITVILSGRSALDEQGEQHLTALNNHMPRGRVIYLQADVSKLADVEQIIKSIRNEVGPLNGIIHSAGILRDSFILKKSGHEMSAVLAPKVTGTLNIDMVTQSEPLDFFVLFSSIAGVLGNVGQADYAAANAFLDAFAHHRQDLVDAGKRPGRTISINWPLWAEGGMSVDANTEKWLANRTGMVPLATAAGVSAFDQILTQGDAVQLLVAQGDRAQIRQRLALTPKSHQEHTAIPTMDSGSVSSGSVSSGSVSSGAVSPGTVSPDSVSPDSVQATQNDRQAQVESHLVALCVELLKVQPNDLDVETNLAEYGVDSILMMSMLNKLEELYGVAVAPTAIAEHPTIKGLAAYLISAGVAGQSEPVPESKVTIALNGTIAKPILVQPNQASDSSGKVAIISQACRLPQSPTLEHFWDNLAAGRDLVTTVPNERWQAESFYNPQPGLPDKTYTNYGAFLDDIGYFDAEYFGIAADAAISMDPQQRIMLELAQELWDRAGYQAENVAGTNTSIFMGAKDNSYTRNHYHLMPPSVIQQTIVNSASNMIAARIADFYNLTGAAKVIDTACSSSLVAVHDACQSILQGESDLAIAGGIFLMVDAFNHISFSQAKVLSHDGKSYVFDERANGFVLGEGGGLVLLKAYDAALRDGDPILGVILGSAVNNDGKTMGLTVPNQTGQKAVIDAALARSNVTPADIGYLEAHGTGTLLGDPIEIRAATEVYRQYTAEKQYCAVGSVKTNLGHTMTAAGITGLIKLVLSLEHQQIPATLHCEKPHPRFQFDKSPFYPNTDLKAWEPRNGRRIGAISSFGFGGTNCHLIVEEGESISTRAQANGQHPDLTKFNRQHYWAGQTVVPQSNGSQSGGSHQLSPASSIEEKNNSVAQQADPPTTAQTNSEALVEPIQRYLGQKLEGILDVKADAIDVTENFMELGVDSTQLITLIQQIETEVALELYPTLLFEYQNIESLAAFLAEEHPAPFAQFLEIDVSVNYTEIHSVAEPQPNRSRRDAKRNTESHREGTEIHRDFREGSAAWSNTDPRTLPEDSPTPTDFAGADYVGLSSTSTRSTHGGPIGEDSVSRAPTTLHQPNEPIAIIGITGIYPQSPDLSTFWQNLVTDKELISEIPPDRWDWQAYYGDPALEKNRTKAKWGAFIQDVDKFDAGFFGITPREAELMDPQQRLFLQTVWQTIEDAGYTPSQLSEQRVALFVGASTQDYARLLYQSHQAIDAHSSTGVSLSVLANRVSYLLNLRGPSELCDTACSSAIVAVHRAIRSIQDEECEMAIAGGVNLILGPDGHIVFDKMGMLCHSGQVATFGENAQGYVRGEGVGAVLLKPLSKAVADGDQIFALIKGSAVHHGGRSQGLTAPSLEGQAEAMIKAYQQAGIAPDSVDYIEAHGTATKLGDPIEIEAFGKAFAALTDNLERSHQEGGHCKIGSLKPNIGHLEAASGMAVLSKVIQAMRARVKQGLKNYTTPNPYIKLDEGPFYITHEHEPWSPRVDEAGNPLPRRASVHSFGFGGVNAHLVLEEYVEEGRGIRDGGLGIGTEEGRSHLILLSAKDEERLRAYAAKMLDFVEARRDSEQTLSLTELAYTLQVGREAMSERLAILVQNQDELRQGLKAFLDNANVDLSTPTLFQGNSKRSTQEVKILIEGLVGEEMIARCIETQDFAKLALLWARGAKISWERLYESNRPQRISLPTYPFAKERYWIPMVEPKSVDIESDRKESVEPESRKLEESIQMAGAAQPAADQEQVKAEKRPELKPDWRAIPPAERANLLRQTLEQVFIQVTKFKPDQIDTKEPLNNLGLDSLMMVDLANTLRRELRVTLPIEHFNPELTLSQLAEQLLPLLEQRPITSETVTGREAEIGQIALPTEFPLTPNQQWFFEGQYANPHHWNIAALLQTPPDLDLAILEEAIRDLFMRHEPLRIRIAEQTSITEEQSGPQRNRQQRIEPIGQELLLDEIDLSYVSKAEQAAAIEAKAEEIQASLDYHQGPIVRFTYFDLGPGDAGRLFAVIHHLVADAFGFYLLLTDLATAYEQRYTGQYTDGQELTLPPLTTSYIEWLQQLSAYAQSTRCQATLPYWLETIQQPVQPLPVDFPDGFNDDHNPTKLLFGLTEEETEALTRHLTKAADVQVPDILLTALLQAYCEWADGDSLWVETQAHGRDTLIEGVDLSQTVCWANTIYPVYLKHVPNASPQEALLHVRDALRRLPNQGLDYGVLRHLNPDPASKKQFQAHPDTEIKFLYHGSLMQSMTTGSELFQPAPEPIGRTYGPGNEAKHKLYIYGHLLNGQLLLELVFSENIFKSSTLERLGEGILKALKDLIDALYVPTL